MTIEKVYNPLFLYIDPIKQGLKPSDSLYESAVHMGFLYIDPIKQGLKPRNQD